MASFPRQVIDPGRSERVLGGLPQAIRRRRGGASACGNKILISVSLWANEVSPARNRRPGVSPSPGNPTDSSLLARGFTLLEMMLVLFIAGVVAAVAVPNLEPAFANMQMRSATRDVVSALRFTRGVALSNGRGAEFLLNVKQHFYRVAGREKKTYKLPSSVKLSLFTADFLMSEGQGSIIFYPDGSASGGRVTLQGAGKTRIVDVVWLTGNVVVREPSDGD